MDLFQKLLKQNKLPVPEVEWKFCETRRWRFDYAWPEQKIAVEQEGGAWSYGRHTRGSGFIKDMEKYNNAVLLGWRVLRYTPDQLLNEAIVDLKTMLGKGEVISPPPSGNSCACVVPDVGSREAHNSAGFCP